MCLAGVLCALSALGYAQTFSADAVKATFLYRFAGYVQWPAAATAEPFVIGVVDDDAIAQELERLLKNISIEGRRAEVKRLRAGDTLEGVRVLFIGASDSIPARRLRQLAVGKPILLVTDTDGGLKSGAVINFVQDQRNVKFEVSLSNALAAGLKIDSRLLSVAVRVDNHK